MRIERIEHAFNGIVEKRLVIDLFNVRAADAFEYFGERAEVLKGQFLLYLRATFNRRLILGDLYRGFFSDTCQRHNDDCTGNQGAEQMFP